MEVIIAKIHYFAIINIKKSITSELLLISEIVVRRVDNNLLTNLSADIIHSSTTAEDSAVDDRQIKPMNSADSVRRILQKQAT